MLSQDEVKAIYDRVGVRQDRGAYYEDGAIAELTTCADWTRAERVFEFGCGTGRVAADLLARHLPVRARYYAVDLSSTMVRLTAARLAPWGDRALVARASGFPRVPISGCSVDRFVALYVLDILPPDAIRALLAEARRVLRPGGRLCLISLTAGATLYAQARTTAWSLVYALRPAAVGGCRPIRLREYLGAEWALHHSSVMTIGGMSSEVIVAGLTGDGARW